MSHSNAFTEAFRRHFPNNDKSTWDEYFKWENRWARAGDAKYLAKKALVNNFMREIDVLNLLVKDLRKENRLLKEQLEQWNS